MSKAGGTGRKGRRTELDRAHEALERSEARFRAYLSATSDVIYRMSADWSEMYDLQGRDFILGAALAELTRS